MARVNIALSTLNNRSKQILIQAGIPEQDAQIVVETLQEAEICGIESHGYTRLLSYVDRIEKGLISPRPNITFTEKSDTILHIDGDNGLGQVVTAQALQRCIEVAKDQGTCFAFIKNSNHFGTCGFYSRIAAQQGMVAFVASNASATMPPFGGVDNLLGTNPFSVSFPAGKYDNFTLDMAMSAVAKGKIRIYEKMGKEIPLGWAMDAQGRDTTDPAKAIEGGLLPMGGHKGYGMAMVIDLLCALLSGARLSGEIESMFSATQPAELGHALFIIDISKLLPLEIFTARVEQWFDTLKNSTVRTGFEHILVPGEIENKKLQSIPDEISLLDKTAQSLGL